MGDSSQERCRQLQQVKGDVVDADARQRAGANPHAHRHRELGSPRMATNLVVVYFLSGRKPRVTRYRLVIQFAGEHNRERCRVKSLEKSLNKMASREGNPDDKPRWWTCFGMLWCCDCQEISCIIDLGNCRMEQLGLFLDNGGGF